MTDPYRLAVIDDEEAFEATLPGRLLLHARRTPNACALRNKDRGIWKEISWRNYCDATAATARMLQELGIGVGDHV
jgi:long-chain acyl-CoA synthetase